MAEATACDLVLLAFAFLPGALAVNISDRLPVTTAASNLLPTPENCLKLMAITICGMLPLAIAYRKRSRSARATVSAEAVTVTSNSERPRESGGRRASVSSVLYDPTTSESSLIRKHTGTISVTTRHFTYPSVRIFHRLHSKAARFERSLPLLVFIHGLGGQLAQFQFVLDYFVHISHTLAIDLPGCGASGFNPKEWDAYTTEALAELIASVVEQYAEKGQKIILIGHSMGCTLAATLASKGGLLQPDCIGLVAICPKAEFTDSERKKLATAVKMGDTIFDMFRQYDRWGGIESHSVNRFIGRSAPTTVKKLQLYFNKHSRTPVWRRMATGMKLPSAEQWRSIGCPVYLLGAAEDLVCPVSELDQIFLWLCERERSPDSKPSLVLNGTGKGVLKKCVIPGAGHSVIYETQHVVNKLVNEFLSLHVDEMLSLAWQLSYLKEDKWLLKNFEKWSRIQSVSPRIGRSPFRAMKTLRQNDEQHSPELLSAKYPDIAHVIDISYEQPPYDPETFGDRIEYHKFATVSKIPPTPDEVSRFVTLINSIRATPDPRPEHERLIACHCHYGFNRTGFFLCSYMIEEVGYTVAEALAEFKLARPPGIKHPHFIAELFERYDCPGLRRPSLS